MRADAFEKPAGHYFLSHSIGLRPLGADKTLEDGFTSVWRRGDPHMWDTWLASLGRFREHLGALIGAEPADLCPQTNISSALAKILFALPERPRRRKIVLTEDDFPTVGFVLAQGQRLGYELVFLPGGSRLADVDAWKPAFQDDVQLVFTTHVFSNSAVLAPAAEIARRARERGVISILDIAQSAGAVPVDLDDIRPDFAVGTSVKYLCGGPGAAFLWTETETAARMAPLDVGWFSHEAPFEMKIRDFRYAQGAARFWGGTPSVAPYVTAIAGLEVLIETGIDRIWAHNQGLLSRLTNALPQRALISHCKEGERGSSILIGVPNAASASRTLTAAGVAHDCRCNALRVSMHLYNTDEDVEALLGILGPVL
jgi:kynureninase